MDTCLRAILLILLFTAHTACETPAGDVSPDPGTEQPSDGPEVNCDENNGGISLPDGFCAAVFAEGVGPARHIDVAPSGDVYVRLRQVQGGGGIVALRDTSGGGRADITERFTDEGGTGIEIHNGYLYYATDTEVRRVELNSGALVPEGEHEVIVTGFPQQDQHAAKSIALGDSDLFVNVGAPSNNCQVQSRTPGSPGQEPCPQLELHAGVWRYDAGQPNQRHSADARYATGIRNAVAIDYKQGDGVYTVQHGRDQLDQLWPDRYTAQENAELPSEEFQRLTEGADFGWPYCYHDPELDQRVLSPEYGGDGEEVGECDQYEDPLLTFPAHYAPNDLLFYSGDHFPSRFQGGAFVAFHGSWNRAPLEQRGYNVAFVPMNGAEPASDWEVFADGFAGQETIESPGQADYRPMGLAEGPDGALFIVDSQEGRIWRVVYEGE